MKFISLFGKTPDHKKFGFKPRYWDQEAEERKEREERIRKEIERERGLKPDPDSYRDDGSHSPDSHRERIAGSFQAARRRSDKPKDELNKVLLRSGALLFLVLFLIAFLQWGNDALYGLVIFIPLYFYMRLKR